MKERFFDLLVETYYSSSKIGDLSEIILNETDPYALLICDLLGIREDEYIDMLDRALEIASAMEYEDMIKVLRNVGIIQKAECVKIEENPV
jgi:hypothetical protein